MPYRYTTVGTTITGTRGPDSSVSTADAYSSVPMSPEGRRKIMTEARSETRPVTDQPTYSDLAMALGGTGFYRTDIRGTLKSRGAFIDSLTEAWKSHEIEFQHSRAVGYVWKSSEDTPAGGSSTFVVCAMGRATDGGPRYLDGGRTALTDSDTTYALSLVAGASGTALHTSGPTWDTYCTTHNQFVVEFPWPFFPIIPILTSIAPCPGNPLWSTSTSARTTAQHPRRGGARRTSSPGSRIASPSVGLGREERSLSTKRTQGLRSSASPKGTSLLPFWPIGNPQRLFVELG